MARRKSHSPGWLFCVGLALALVLAGCGSGAGEAVRLDGRTMGTTWSVTYSPAGGAPPAESVREALQARLDGVNASMSTYRDDSEITRFNGAPVGEWFTVSEAFLTVLGAALDIGARSEGAYDVTVAPLVDLWGFGPGAGAGGVPDAAAIAALRPQVGQRYLEIDRAASRVRKTRAVSVDFSSIAKGYAVDELARYLLGQQIADFLVEVGGEMRLSGSSPRGDAWRIAVEQPTAGARAPAVALRPGDAAVATSGDYRNFFEMDGRRYSHSIDPRSGYPVAHDLVSVTVVADTAMVADAWATALEVLGAEDAMRVANAQALAVYFIRRQGDDFVASHSASFAPYLEGPDGATTQGQGAPER
ncbi:FAD:protein FMN transferase [Parahaliea mediterranea]|uniref:FAD:protein FMN transferase n=1 Tax=Parahaliea mediterranea TaxID=651086 RepID=A0A939DIZ0_9GAMM|nr:FAD:protein FMN transferase [Parahaliea mediterranea]MBN7798397.1 FAD:protein FMN transferase [Parahaliea mediterranea]